LILLSALLVCVICLIGVKYVQNNVFYCVYVHVSFLVTTQQVGENGKEEKILKILKIFKKI